jgi:chemotaxis response regulator CheB
LKPISKLRGWPDVIAVFLRSLAETWNAKLIAVIVSRYDEDGAASFSEIRGVGGITIAQKLEAAEHPDIPESAIASDCVDFVLSPEGIAREIARIALGPAPPSRPPSGEWHGRGEDSRRD